MKLLQKLRDLFRVETDTYIPIRLHLPLTRRKFRYSLETIIEGSNTEENLILRPRDRVYAQPNTKDEPCILKVWVTPEGWYLRDPETYECYEIGDLLWIEK